MTTLTSLPPLRIAEETFQLRAYCTIPGMGVLPMNAALLRGPQPVLIDAGPFATAAALLDQLSRLIDLDDLRWVWLTHADPDHIGAVRELVERAPKARFVTNFIGLGKLALLQLVPPERAYLINPGQRLSIGDRELIALRPPIYDAPESMMAFDPHTRSLFSADTFGALLEGPGEMAGDIEPGVLEAGMRAWASVDAPWLEHTPTSVLARACRVVEELEPLGIFSAHLPPAFGMASRLVANLVRASGSRPFVGPDEETLAGSGR